MTEERHLQIIQYFQGDLSEFETKDLFAAMQKDSEMQKTFALEKEIMDATDENSWSFEAGKNVKERKELLEILQNNQAKTVKKAIQEAKSREGKRGRKTKRMPAFAIGIAASIALIIGVFTLTPNNFDAQATYASYYDANTLPAFQKRSDNTIGALEKGVQLYTKGNYTQAITSLENIPAAEQDMASQVYLAFSYAEDERYQKAKQVLQNINDKKFMDAEKKYWYLALIHVKANQTAQAKQNLQYIIDHNLFQVTEAKKLLEELP